MRSSRVRRASAVLIILGSLAASLSVSPVLALDWEEVVFRVTIEGPVPAAHTFGVKRQCESTCVTDSIVILCSPPSEHRQPNVETCAARTYESITLVAAGQTLSYALVRWTTPDLTHTATQPQEYLHGTWVVQPGRQVLSLGYAYPVAGGLPNTAMATP